jgi:hypothetical protein
MRQTLLALALLIVGTAQMIGDLSGFGALRALGLATHASPAPKVFTAQEGFETYANRFFVEWINETGSWESVEITPEIYQQLKGPYNRRNLYGAATSYGPVLAANPATAPMLRSVLAYSFCNHAPLLAELGLEQARNSSLKRMRLEPRGQKYKSEQWKLEIEIACA